MTAETTVLKLPCSLRPPWTTFASLVLWTAPKTRSSSHGWGHRAVLFIWGSLCSCGQHPDSLQAFFSGFQNTGVIRMLIRHEPYFTWSQASLAQTGHMVKMMNILHLPFTLKLCWIVSDCLDSLLCSGMLKDSHAHFAMQTIKPHLY